MNMKDTSIADIIVYMIKNNTDNVAVDFKIKGKKMALNIELVSRESEEKWIKDNAKSKQKNKH